MIYFENISAIYCRAPRHSVEETRYSFEEESSLEYCKLMSCTVYNSDNHSIVYISKSYLAMHAKPNYLIIPLTPCS